MKTTKTQFFTLIFVIAITGVVTLANLINVPFIKNSKIVLGLDLQGGTDILLQVNVQGYIQNYKQNLVKELKTALYESKIGYNNFYVLGDNISFELRSLADDKQSKKILKKLGTKFKENGGVFTVDVSQAVLDVLKKKVVEQSIEVIRKRIDELGNKEISITAVDDDKISLQIPGKNDPDAVAKLLNTQARLTFHLMDDQPFTEQRIEKYGVKYLLGENEGYYYAISEDIIIDGADLDDASATITENGEAAVGFKFNNRAARIFGEVTTQNIGKPFAIVLDNKVLSAPNIKEPILGGSGIISGTFTAKEANELALLLRAGALPAEVDIVQQQEIAATLGRESINIGIKCTIAGFALVCIFMLIRYRLYGVYAIIALLVNMFCVFAFLSIFQSTLTFPGIAGIILTIGMAVDGNIIIFENIKYMQDKLGKTDVLEEAFANAQTSILDANITTIFGAIMLYQFGFGAIKGFALTLIIGVIFSIFTSLFVTKVLVGIKKARLVV